MLSTALKPRWIALLILVLAAAAVFVGLSKWQFETAETSAPPPLSQTENPVPLTEHFQPQQPMLGTEADQVVEFAGSYVPQHQVLVSGRLHQGEPGYWVVTAATVDGAPNGELIPVVRGWTDDPSATDPAPEGEVAITGRLLPTDAPIADGTERTETGTVVESLATAELINLWDAPSYAGFVTAFEVVGAPGTAAAGENVGSEAAGGALQPVWVSPQPQETSIVWMNIFYAVEWAIFAGFALFLWWRFVRDDYLKDRREADLDADWAARWRAEELARRREEARRAKAEATAAYEAYHQGDDHDRAGARGDEVLAGSSAARPVPHGTESTASHRRRAETPSQEDA